MKYAMDNGSQSVTPLKWNELSDVKSAVICVIIVLNVILNSLVIAVIIRYPQLREDRTILFMFSLAGVPSCPSAPPCAPGNCRESSMKWVSFRKHTRLRDGGLVTIRYTTCVG